MISQSGIYKGFLAIKRFYGAAARQEIFFQSSLYDFGESSEIVRSRSLLRRFRRFSGSPRTNCPLSALFPISSQ